MNASRKNTACKRFLNQKETAEYLGVNAVTIRKAIKAGTIPYKRLGRLYVFSVQALEQWAGNWDKNEVNNQNNNLFDSVEL